MRWSMDQDGTWLHVLVEDGQAARRYAQENGQYQQRVVLTRWREKRSLTANAYAWVLMGKLSQVLRIPPLEIYRQLIPDVGGNTSAVSVPEESLDMLRDGWRHNGLGWIVEVIGRGSEPGMVDVILYYGSSVYDTAQMARLIDLIIDACRENGVEHLPPDKINAMLEEWDAQKNKSAGDQPRCEKAGL